jgi:hypothetical protein
MRGRGRMSKLKGINVYSFHEPTLPIAIRWCKDNGFNHIRYCLVSAPTTDQYTEQYDPWGFGGSEVWAAKNATYTHFIDYLYRHAARLCRYQDLCLSSGVSITLDMHSYFGCEANEQGHLLFQSEILKDIFISGWEHLAIWLKGRPHIYGFDLINEPRMRDFNRHYTPFIREVIERIRKEDGSRICIVEGQNDDLVNMTLLDVKALTSYKNVELSGHWYWRTDFTVGGKGNYPRAGLNRDKIIDRIGNVAEWCKDNKIRSYVGEIGINHYSEGHLQWLEDSWRTLRRRGFNVVGYSFHKLNQDPAGDRESTRNPQLTPEVQARILSIMRL